MGYIKEPKGVYLIIPPSKLSKEEAAGIAEFIRKDKLKSEKAEKNLTRPGKIRKK
jgi:hypothetical protein